MPAAVQSAESQSDQDEPAGPARPLVDG